MRKLIGAAAAFVFIVGGAVAQSVVYPPPAVPTTAQPVFQVNAANGMSAGGVSNPRATPSMAVTTYSPGFVLGGVMTFTVPSYGLVANAEVVLNSGAYTSGVDLQLFDAAPTGGGTSDNAAMAISTTDVAKLIGVLHLTDCKLLSTVASACQISGGSSQLYNLGTGTTLYVVAQLLGSGTFTGTGDAAFKIKVVQQ